MDAIQLNADLNFYHFRQHGTYNDLDFGFSSSSSFGQLSAQWTVSKSLIAQGKYYYNGPSETIQSRVRAMHWANFGIGKNLLAERLSVIADVTNLFDSRRYRSTVSGPDFVSAAMSRFNGVRCRLSLVYKLNANAAAREAKAANRH